MDSEDELSGLSSQDGFGEDMDSDDGSLGEGMSSSPIERRRNTLS